MRAASAAEAPPDDPPGVFPRSHGLRVIPVSSQSPTAFHPNSGIVVFPKITAPCSLNLATQGASSSQGPSGSTLKDPRRVGQPLVKTISFIEIGTPSKRPCGFPSFHRFSESFACVKAASSSTKINALISLSRSSTRPKTALITSTGEASLRSNKPNKSLADL